MMSEVHGSIPVFSFVLKDFSFNDMTMIAMVTTKLYEMGWVWYKDFNYNFDAKELVFEVYNEKLVNIVKELIVENNI